MILVRFLSLSAADQFSEPLASLGLSVLGQVVSMDMML